MNPNLEPLTDRIAKLPMSDKGYPVPWFVEWVDGKPEFRAMDPRKWVRATRENLCWVCGGKMGRYVTFVVGPMCGINRVSGEPPSHLDCAHWSARNCPFLSTPHMVRREEGLEGAGVIGGEMLKHNPGVTLLWTTTNYEVATDGRGGRIIHFSNPVKIEWYTKGRAASREEVERAIDKGFPKLLAMAKLDGDKAVAECLLAKEHFLKMAFA